MTADHPVRPWYVCSGNPCTCTKPGRAPDLSPAEAARVAEFDAAPEPPEIRVERVRALADELDWLVQDETVDETARVAHAWTLHRLRRALDADAALAGQRTTDEPCSEPSYGADTPCVLPDGHVGGCLR